MVNISNDLLEVRTEKFDLRSSGTFNINNTNGDIDICEWDSSFIQVETSIYGDSSRGIPSDLHIRWEQLENELSCTVDYPGGLSFISVDFCVCVPPNSEYLLNVVTVNGESAVDARLSAFVESVNGDISVKASSTRGLFTVNGDVSAVLENQTEPFAAETVNGDLFIELHENLGLVVETVNGDVTINGKEYGDEVTMEGSNQAAAVLETVNGNIDVKRFN
jgi:DUF4097 and DUF4098 domain-containing protein YvlB